MWKRLGTALAAGLALLLVVLGVRKNHGKASQAEKTSREQMSAEKNRIEADANAARERIEDEADADRAEAIANRERLRDRDRDVKSELLDRLKTRSERQRRLNRSRSGQHPRSD